MSTMNSKALEARRQKFDHFKKQALLVFTTALRGPLILMMGCGLAEDAGGYTFEVHDHTGKKMVYLPEKDVLYNEEIHGLLKEWVEEGERVPGVPDSLDGRAPIHRHNTKPGFSETSGPYEYVYEKKQSLPTPIPSLPGV